LKAVWVAKKRGFITESIQFVGEKLSPSEGGNEIEAIRYFIFDAERSLYPRHECVSIFAKGCPYG
jgi:hypothetical protein